MKAKKIKIFCLICTLLSLFLVKAYSWSDDDAAESWDSDQQEDDNFYSGNYDDVDWDSIDHGTVDEETAAYNAALAAYQAMLAEEDKYTLVELLQAKDAVEEAFGRLSAAYAEEGKTISMSTTGEYGKILDENGKIVGVIGDPVRVSSGIYLHNVSDLFAEYGACSLHIERTFLSANSKNNVNFRSSFSPSFFGRGWKTNLETRIIRGAYPYGTFDEEKYKKAKEILESYLEECREDYPEAITLFEEFECENADFKEKCEQSQKNKERNKFVDYGEGGKYSESIEPDSLIFVDEKGFSYILTLEDGVYQNKSFEHAEFVVEENESGYVVKYQNGKSLFYNYYGQLEKEINIHQKEICYFWNGKELQSININNGKKIAFEWTDGKISGISDGAKALSYLYDGDYLTTVSDTDGFSAGYSYDENKNISDVIKSDGSFSRISYYAPEKDKIYVNCVKNENGAKEYFSYNLKKRLTEYTDPDGVITKFYWDGQGRTISEEYADGRFNSFKYNSDGKLCEAVCNGRKAVYTYDKENHLRSIKYDDSAVQEYSYYGNNLVFFMSENGMKFNFSYNPASLCTHIFCNNELLYSYVYDAKGFLISKKDCRGNEEKYTYDIYGNLIQKGNEKWTYDKKNRIASHFSKDGIEATFSYSKDSACIEYSNGLKVTQKFSIRGDVIEQIEEDLLTGRKKILNYEYDSTHHLLRIKNDKNILREFTWSDGGRLLENIVYNFGVSNDSLSKYISRQIWKNGLKTSLSLQRFDENADQIDLKNCDFSTVIDGRRKTIFSFFDDDTVTQETFYDDIPEIYKINGQTVTAFDINPAAQIIKKRFAFGSYDYLYENGRLLSITPSSEDFTGVSFKYYPDGLLKTFTDKYGIEWSIEYGQNNKIKQVSSDYGKLNYNFDEAGRFISLEIYDEKNRLIRKTDRVYAKDGRSSQTIFGEYIKVENKYDAFGNIVEQIDGDGNSTVFEYDDYNRLIQKKDCRNNVCRYFYDSCSNLTRIINENGQTTDFFYDINGNRIAARDVNGYLFKAKYDNFNNLIEYEQRPFSKKRMYVYDDFGRVLEIKSDETVLAKNVFDSSSPGFLQLDGKGKERKIKKDNYENFLSVQNRLLESEFFSYDRFGFLKTYTDYNGNKTIYERSSNFRNKKMIFDDGTFCEYEKNFAGQLIKAKNENSVLSYEYDLSGNLIKIEDSFSGKVILYQRDFCGRIKNVSCDERQIRYTWKDGLLDSIEDVNENIKVNFKYSRTKKEIERIFSTGETIKTWYDESDRTILKAGYLKNGTLCFVNGKVYDKRGFITYTLNSDFSVTKYEYDEDGRIHRAGYLWTDEYEKYFKNLCGEAGLYVRDTPLSSNIVNTSEEDYCALQKLCSYLLGSSNQIHLTAELLTVEYKYDINGNLIEQKTPFGSIHYKYDDEDRLILWGESCSAVWDKNGNILKKITAFNSQIFEYTRENRIKRVESIDFIDNSFTVQRYLYDALGRRIQTYSSTKGTIKNMYAGFSFEVFYSWLSENTATSEEEIENNYRYSKIENYSSENYRFETKLNQKTKNAAKSIFYTMYDNTGRPMFLINKNTSAEWQRQALFTDFEGTVVKSCTEADIIYDYEYDCFGSVINSDSKMIYGFAGKNYDKTTSLYDFGYRNYLGQWGRFITVDPIKDGLNWYSYCNGNPVSFIDIDGLFIIDPEFKDMHDDQWDDTTINYTGTTIGEEGCTVTAVAEVMSSLTGENYTPSDVANMDIFSSAKGQEDCVDWSKIESFDGREYDVTYMGQEQGYSSRDIVSTIVDCKNSDSHYGIAARVEYNANRNTHYVCLTGTFAAVNGHLMAGIVGTSNRDNNILGNCREGRGWTSKDGQTFVPVEAIQSIVTVRASKDR